MRSLMIVVCLVVMSATCEARWKSKASASIRQHGNTIVSRTNAVCRDGSCGVSRVSSVVKQTGNWSEIAQIEASTGGPTQHHFQGQSLAAIAAQTGRQVFIGVGCGQTCCPSGGGWSLVGEATTGRKTARIWIR